MDDEVLGCGGSAIRWSQSGERVRILLLGDGESARADFENCEDMSLQPDMKKKIEND